MTISELKWCAKDKGFKVTKALLKIASKLEHCPQQGCDICFHSYGVIRVKK